MKLSKAGARGSLDEWKRLAIKLAEAGNTQLLRELESAFPCVSLPSSALQAKKGPNTAKAPKTRQMSRTEKEFELIIRKRFPEYEITWEKYTFTLAPRCRYTPDFCVTNKVGVLMFYEVKGAYLFAGAHKSATATSLTKPKIAAEMFRHRFVIAQKIDGQWFEKSLPGKIDER